MCNCGKVTTSSVTSNQLPQPTSAEQAKTAQDTATQAVNNSRS